jgi:hypothetical protein
MGVIEGLINDALGTGFAQALIFVARAKNELGRSLRSEQATGVGVKGKSHDGAAFGACGGSGRGEYSAVPGMDAVKNSNRHMARHFKRG